jgi:hypothetical protein
MVAVAFPDLTFVSARLCWDGSVFDVQAFGLNRVVTFGTYGLLGAFAGTEALKTFEFIFHVQIALSHGKSL